MLPYMIFDAPPEHQYGAPSSSPKPAAMAASGELPGGDADGRSKPPKMTATTRGFRSLNLLPAHDPTSGISPDPAASTHPIHGQQPITPNRDGLKPISLPVQRRSTPDPTPLPNPSAGQHPNHASTTEQQLHPASMAKSTTSPAAPSAHTRHAHLLHPKSSLFLPQNPSRPFRPTVRHRTADPSAHRHPSAAPRSRLRCSPSTARHPAAARHHAKQSHAITPSSCMPPVRPIHLPAASMPHRQQPMATIQ
ncbi:hypothetical protein ACLOJK_022620 [Asimina triloba]